MKPVPLGEIVACFTVRGGSCLACQRRFGFGEKRGGMVACPWAGETLCVTLTRTEAGARCEASVSLPG